MSHKWTANTYTMLVEQRMVEATSDVQTLPWLISHNNVNLPMRIFSQRLHNQSHFFSGCAATVWVLPAAAALPISFNSELQIHRAEGIQEQFSYAKLLNGSPLIHQRIQKQYVHHVLQFLLNSPDFGDYSKRDDEYFKPPPPVNLLACGPENVVKQHILRTINQEEASYEGNDKAIEELFRQLGMSSEEEQQKTGKERVIAWVGDQLTVEWLHGLFRYRYEDFNAFDRMDYMLPVFGWFHLQMAFANSLHKQYLGTAAVVGSLQQAFDVLQRKGLQKSETKGPFWHHLHEAIHHVGEAHIRASWLAVAEVDSLAKLKDRSPAELSELATRLVDEQASQKGLARMSNTPLKDWDAVLMQSIMFNHDILSYIELSAAMKCGDIGHMEDLLPTLLFRFAGGGNSKYTIEVLELLQGLRQEWPEDIRCVTPSSSS